MVRSKVHSVTVRVSEVAVWLPVQCWL
jgi:hypothetical protein